MKLYELLNEADYLDILNPIDVEIKGITYDSRKVKRGFMFVALPGTKTDGKKFIYSAAEKNAAAIAADAPIDIRIPLVVTQDPRKFLAQISLKFFSHPEKRLKIIGITGTNGKTTTSYLIKAIIEEQGKKSGLIGTIKYFDGKEWIEFPEHTTPESPELAFMFSKMVENKAEYCVMEVSSHALALNRVYGIDFEAAVLTNIGHDHLDFHKTLHEYVKVKLKLFQGLKKGFAVLPADDKKFPLFYENTSVEIITYGMKKKADIIVRLVKSDLEGIRGEILYRNKKIEFESELIGKHNVYNIAAAFATGIGFGFDEEKIVKGIEKIKRVEGRTEKIKTNNNAWIIIDYAHTPDALKNVLSSLREVAEKRIITIFGCGGDRDRKKRPLMGKVASSFSDHVIITNDNPRTEDPEKIIADIVKGVFGSYEVIPDRREAIFKGVSMLSENDILLIAGKGHEKYQIIGDHKIPFDDKGTAEEAINALGR